MAVNKPKGDNARIGAVKGRSQTFTTGRFMDVKTSGGKFKGVRKEKQ